MVNALKKLEHSLVPIPGRKGGGSLEAQSQTPRRGRSRRVRLSTLVCAVLLIVLPTALAVVYYGFVATGRYVSNAQVTVRSSDSVSSASMDSLLGGIVSGSSSSSKEAYIVQEYVGSQEILRTLQDWLDLRAMWSAQSIDALSRLEPNASEEDLHSYYLSMVSATYDSEKNVIDLEVQAYAKDDAVALATSIITLSESLVNRVSSRIREDAVKFAKQEVKTAEERLRDARLDLKAFQNKHGDLDPQQTASSIGGIVAELESQLAQIRTKIAAQSTYMRSDSAAMEALYAEEKALEQQLERERRRLAGNGAASGQAYSDVLVDYERLKIQQEFAKQAYEMSQTALEQARLEAARKQLYLVDFVEPTTPDEATRPQRMRNVLIAFVGGVVAFAVVTLLLGAIREHARV